MIFNSYLFALSFLIFLICFYILPVKMRLACVFIFSCLFYGLWDKYFLLLLFISVTIDYFSARLIEKDQRPYRRKTYLIISISINLLLLFLFKYFMFAQDMTIKFLHFFGLTPTPLLTNIIYPLGISFYTFQSLGYVLDVYNKRYKCEKNFLYFSTFVIFFPQLVSGPIERATHLLPQLKNLKGANNLQIRQGLFLLLQGFFLKSFLADNISRIADFYFSPSILTSISVPQTVLGITSFAIQIYGDFAGYSFIALGLAKFIGIDLTVNFKRPFLATSFSDFWKRWNITVSEWFRDYVYIPLGGSQFGHFKKIRNLILTMGISGLWHGAHIMKVSWGLYHGVMLVFTSGDFLKFKKNRDSLIFQKIKNNINFFFYLFFSFWGYFLFRAQSLEQAQSYVKAYIYGWNFPLQETFYVHLFWVSLFFILLIAYEIYQEKIQDIYVLKFKNWHEFIIALFIFGLILVFGGKSESFIYFQF